MISSTLRRTAVVVALATATAGLVGTVATAAEPTRTSLSIPAVKSAVRPGGTSTSGVATVRVRTPEHPPRRLPTSLSIRVAKPRVGLDGTDTITGRLRSRGFPLVRKWVLLLSKEDGATKWAFDGALQTKGRGQVAFTVSPSVGTRYRLAFLGTPNFRPARSAVVHVAARPTALSINASPKFIDPGGSSTVSGVLTNAGAPFAGQAVQLKSKVVGSGDPFATEATGTTAADGSVSFTVTPTRSTKYHLFLPASTGVPAAKSPVATVLLKWATSLSIRGKVTPKGYVVSGDLHGHSMGLAGRKVTLQKQASGETTWTDVATKRTGRQGHVRFVQPIAAGTSYRLWFAGGARFAASTSGIVVQ
jgi:hypothetical protein